MDWIRLEDVRKVIAPSETMALPASDAERASSTSTGWLPAQLDRAAELETAIQARAESLILSPGHFVVQTVPLLWRTRATIHDAQDSSDGRYSPMILTSTRFRRRPSILPGQPFCLALKDLLPRAKDFDKLS